MHDSIIKICDLHFAYPDGASVLKGLSLEVNRGEIFGLLGPNGAGKSTTFRILAGLDKPDRGFVLIAGKLVRSDDRAIYRNIGYMPDAGEVFDSSTVENLLRFFGRSQNLDEAALTERINRLLDRFHFARLRHVELRKLSKGLRQQAHIMRCLVHEPPILILDEPASHLDPVSRKLLLDILREECDRGTTILISSHILPELSDLCSSVAIIDDGRVIDQGRVSELIEKHQNRFATYSLRASDGLVVAQRLLLTHTDPPVLSLESTSPETLVFDFVGERDRIATVLELLVKSNVRVTEFARQRKDIEQIYLEMVKLRE
jgi:ABC-2 type transport system ATP-binding protein